MITTGPVEHPYRRLDDLARDGSGRPWHRPLPVLADGAKHDEHDEEGRQRRRDGRVDLGQGNQGAHADE
jgi:hypothetical protein